MHRRFSVHTAVTDNNCVTVKNNIRCSDYSCDNCFCISFTNVLVAECKTYSVTYNALEVSFDARAPYKTMFTYFTYTYSVYNNDISCP